MMLALLLMVPPSWLSNLPPASIVTVPKLIAVTAEAPVVVNVPPFPITVDPPNC